MVISFELPVKKNLLIKPGQKVNLQTPLVKKSTVTEVKIILADKIGVSPEKIFSYIKKFVGEKVQKGELLAEKKGFFSIKKIYSDFDAIIKEVNHQEGYLLLETETVESDTLNSYFQGEVEEVDNGMIKLKVEKYKEFEIKESDSGFGGSCFYLHDLSKVESLTAEEVDGKIIVVESLNTYALAKLDALGSLGFVTVEKLPDEIDYPSARIKNTEDLKKIFELNFSYCIIDRKNNRIYFYK